jgi:hypothetical protein
MKVLILGNGISRALFASAINDWQGEVWGCNRAYLDYGKKLTLIAGHRDVMDDASDYRKLNALSYKIIGSIIEGPIDCKLTCNVEFRKDTGTTLVAEALTHGYDVELVGFDLGGKDIYSPNHQMFNKTSWVRRWRKLFSVFDSNKVTFWGYDHKPFILSNMPADTYALKYNNSKAHIDNPEYEKLLSVYTDAYYKALWDRLPKVALKNIGKREWTFNCVTELFKPEHIAYVPRGTALKAIADYPRDFIIMESTHA